MSAAQAREPSHRAMEQAAEWYALLRSGEASSAERLQWQQWFDRAAEHREAWLYVERIGRRFAPLQSSPDRDAAVSAFGQAVSAGPRRRRRLLLGLAGMLGIGALGWTAWRQTPLPIVASTWGADHRAGIGETRRIALADGSQVWLKALSAFDVDYSGTLRRLRLVGGEMLIATAKDPLRPFVVDTAQGRLQALGTRFTVRGEEGGVVVAVHEGAVRVDTAVSRSSGIVPAGRQARFTADTLEAMTPADPAREAWTRGALVADDTPLGQVVEELRRYHFGHLAVAPELAHLPVFGSYPIQDTERALDMLASVLPVRVRRTLPWWISIEPRA
ncbi:FecR domain-containing protein [Achromobacter arsenitoxydans]|uniref:FecR protein n=1 Tax=Achromobacter arsenitoxydans SY8 TaxID=477184 RepID=H0FEJ2_9BURK|nr:FecR family protein [Achromobacter arsenitoxydans]EHK63299.1 FecR protein [Achromobacter arsenitoxydans SY8]